MKCNTNSACGGVSTRALNCGSPECLRQVRAEGVRLETSRMRFVVFLSVCLPGALVAQNISCSLSGSVSDPGGAVMPGVTVSVSSEQNGFARTATTNAEGFFSFPDLTASTFSLM